MSGTDLPDWTEPLFTPARYKILYGGRGGAKSWSIAKVLLIIGRQRQLRILCAREFQKSIRESVHQLLTDQIVEMGMEDHYDVLETEIRGKNGTTITYTGLAQHTVSSIKSFEGVDVVWIEEAHAVSKKSWNVLIPTIRKGGSEIWISFNPLLDTDDTYVRFVVNTPPNAILIEVNYDDNPWFSEELEAERLHCLATQPKDEYENIWLGKCRTAVEGAIFAGEVENMVREGRVTRVPYDPTLKVHLVFDLGWNDAMSISFCQRVRSDLRVIDYIEDSHRTLDSYAAEVKGKKYNLGKAFLPHDGYHKDFKTGRSAEEILKKFGFTVRPVPKESVESGIKAARMMLNQMVIDKEKCARLIECAKRYRRAVPTSTGEPGAPLHDEFSHGGDNLRYIALCADKMTNEDETQELVLPGWEPFDPDMGT